MYVCMYVTHTPPRPRKFHSGKIVVHKPSQPTPLLHVAQSEFESQSGEPPSLRRNKYDRGKGSNPSCRMAQSFEKPGASSFKSLKNASCNIQDASKEPPRRLQEPPRYCQDTPAGGQKAVLFHSCFNGFAFLGFLGAILAQHGLLDAPKSFQDASKRRQDASKTLSRSSRTRPRASKMRPRASKTPPRANRNGLLQMPPADASCRRLLQTPWPSTEGGLGVVRPRRSLRFARPPRCVSRVFRTG